MSPDGRFIAWTEHMEETMQLSYQSVDDESRRWIAKLPWIQSHDYEGIAFSRDGLVVAVAIDESAQVFDSASGEPRSDILGFAGSIVNIAVDPMSTLAAVALDTKRVEIVDIRTKAVVASFPYSSNRVGGGSIVFSEDGKTIYATFAGSSLNQQRIWSWRVQADDVASAVASRLNGTSFDAANAIR